jgi:hypothetical protein
MVSVHVSAVTTAPPEAVLAAARDFSDERAKVWRNVRAGEIDVHDSGPAFAEVTERLAPARSFWERGRYDWSEAGCVRQTVVSSNVLEPGSTWELRATPHDGGGSDVEMSLQRVFLPTVRGRVGGALNHLGGHRGWASYLRKSLKAIEKEQERSGSSAAQAGGRRA